MMATKSKLTPKTPTQESGEKSVRTKLHAFPPFISSGIHVVDFNTTGSERRVGTNGQGNGSMAVLDPSLAGGRVLDFNTKTLSPTNNSSAYPLPHNVMCPDTTATDEISSGVKHDDIHDTDVEDTEQDGGYNADAEDTDTDAEDTATNEISSGIERDDSHDTDVEDTKQDGGYNADAEDTNTNTEDTTTYEISSSIERDNSYDTKQDDGYDTNVKDTDSVYTPRLGDGYGYDTDDEYNNNE
ncbi:hypothetical protein AX14_012618 [Amanita brunnescens Koide BX004]|nr:hypothetical protein AX14_012618 [Amanita brunnescens Koide BX004]